MTPISYDAAFAATSDNPADYPGVDPNNPDSLKQRRDSAAQAIMAGVAANDQYWNSRSQLEALQARADGHGQVVNPNTDETPAPLADAEATAIDEPEPDSSSALNAGKPAEGATDATVNAPTANKAGADTGNQDSLTKLRAQLRRAGMRPEA